MPSASFTSNAIFMFNNSTVTHVAGDQVNWNFSFQSSSRATRFSTPYRQQQNSAHDPTGNSTERTAIGQSEAQKSIVSIHVQPNKPSFEDSRVEPRNSEVPDGSSHDLLPLSRNNLTGSVVARPQSCAAAKPFPRESPKTPTPDYNCNEHISGSSFSPERSAETRDGWENKVQVNPSQATLILGDGRGDNSRPWIQMAPSSTPRSRTFHPRPAESYDHYEQSSSRVVSVQQVSSTQFHVNTPRNTSTDTCHTMTPQEYHHSTEAASGLQQLMHLQAIAQMISTKRGRANLR